MTYLEAYLTEVEKEIPGIRATLRASADEFAQKRLEPFNFNEHVAGLLFGHVQSGKTVQMFALASAAADKEFRFFVLLTTNNVRLYRQTLSRAQALLGTSDNGFRVLGETDDGKFLKITSHANPTLVVLKKDASVLRSWLNHVRSASAFKDEPVFLLDDEGDASSLNTNINRENVDASVINRSLDGFRLQAPASFYLHVTATPQSLLLQSAQSAWKPTFAHYIPPGHGYLGGDFFYGENNRCIRVTADNEKETLVRTQEIPEGFRKAILSFLVVGAHRLIMNERSVCSLLIHPGIAISEHEVAKQKAERYLAEIKSDLLNDAKTFSHGLQDAWRDLKTTKADLRPFDEIVAYLRGRLPQIKVTALNSTTIDGTRYDTGLNILTGGNSLGRGVTFPGLHTVYYCRSSKTPQADTCWQHARAFGYDRDPDLCRIFTPNALANLFRELNETNNALFAALRKDGPEAIAIFTPTGTRPTRTNVIKNSEIVILAGGVNYFPFRPLATHLAELDVLLDARQDGDRPASIDILLKALALIEVEKGDSWETHKIRKCVEEIKMSGMNPDCRLIVRVNRNVSQGTGTLLSQTDRELGMLYKDQLVLTVYRVGGKAEQGWGGSPLWVPNMNFPEGKGFYLNAG